MTRRLCWIVLLVTVPFGVGRLEASEAADPVPPGPHSEGRLFDKRSPEVWELVLKGLPALGLPPDEIDRKNQVILTQWRRPGSKGLEWLPSRFLVTAPMIAFGRGCRYAPTGR